MENVPRLQNKVKSWRVVVRAGRGLRVMAERLSKTSSHDGN